MLDLTTVTMDEFPLRWRFTDPKHRLLPSADLAQIEPLDARSARRLLELSSRWHPMPPSVRASFASVAKTSIDACGAEAVARVQDWLCQRGVPLNKQVFALWDSHTALTTRWEIIAKYWDVFWYPSSDDLLIFDTSLGWVLFLWHEEEAFFASTSS